MAAERTPKKRGAKGGVKHQPGRGHDRKSSPAKRKRFARNAAKKRQLRIVEARKAWSEWDAVPEHAKPLLNPPSMPRPTDE